MPDNRMDPWRLAAAAPDLYNALVETRKIICEGAVVGFNPHDGGDWAERLYLNNANIHEALSKAEGKVEGN